jgi:hypothetical protein
MNIRKKAELLNKALITKTRDDGTKYICVDGYAGKDYPQWMQDVVFAGHIDTMPNDEYYRAISNIVSDIVDLDEDITELDDIREYISDNTEADIYTSDLTGWLNSRNSHVEYLTEAMNEYGATDGFQALGAAQIIWKREIAEAVIQALDEAEADEDC